MSEQPAKRAKEEAAAAKESKVENPVVFMDI